MEASAMRKLTEEMRSKDVETRRLKRIYKKIERAARKGYSHISITNWTVLELCELERKGYNLEHRSFYTHNWIDVSWSNKKRTEPPKED